MTVFKGYLRSAWRMRYAMLPYIVIYLVFTMTFVILGAPGKNAGMTFQQSRLGIALEDKDNSMVSAAVRSYLEKHHDITESGGSLDLKRLQEKLYYARIQAVVRIPEGFGEAFLSGGKENEILVTGQPGSTDTAYLQMGLGGALRMAKAYLAAGDSPEAALNKGMEGINGNTQIHSNAAKKESASSVRQTAVTRYLPYVILSLLCFLLGYVVREYRKPDMRKRLQAGAKSVFRRNLEQLLAFGVIGLFLFLLILILLTVMTGGDFLKDRAVVYYAGNILCMILAGLSLAFFVGVINKDTDALNGMVNIIALGMCLLGGVLVPESFLSSRVLKLSRFFPTYWYENTNTILSTHNTLSDKLVGQVYEGYGFQILMAAAVIAVTLAIAKYQEQEI